MQLRRLSRAAGNKLCRKHAWNARSKQRHVPDAKQVLLWKGWVLTQRLHDVQSCVGATATRAHVESPLRTQLFVDSCSARHQGNCCASTREIPATWISIRTQGAERCSRDKTAAFSRHKHTWISLRAQRDTSHRKDCCVLTTRAHLDLFRAQTDMFIRQHCCIFARHKHTCISLRAQRDMFLRKKTAAYSRHKHTCISLRAQARTHVHATDCCVRTPQAHLDLSPCAQRHVPSTRLLRSHAASTLGSLSVRKQEHMFMRQTAAFERHKHTWISLRAQRDMFLQNDCCDREPVTRNPGHRAFALQIVDPISVHAVGEGLELTEKSNYKHHNYMDPYQCGNADSTNIY